MMKTSASQSINRGSIPLSNHGKGFKSVIINFCFALSNRNDVENNTKFTCSVVTCNQ